MKQSYINFGLFALGGIIMWFFAFPFYAGNGQNILGVKSVMDYKKENLGKMQDLALAEELQDRVKSETAAYEALDLTLRQKVTQMIPVKVDIPRLFNDVSALVKNAGLKLDDITYGKTVSPDGIESLNGYKINLSMSGDYLNFREFIKSLQSSLQLYRISSMTFTSVKSSDTKNTQDDNGKSNGQKFQVSFDAYEFKN